MALISVIEALTLALVKLKRKKNKPFTMNEPLPKSETLAPESLTLLSKQVLERTHQIIKLTPLARTPAIPRIAIPLPIKITATQPIKIQRVMLKSSTLEMVNKIIVLSSRLIKTRIINIKVVVQAINVGKTLLLPNPTPPKNVM